MYPNSTLIQSTPFSHPFQPHRSADAAAAAATTTTTETKPKFRPGAETMPFQAEVNRLMDIIVHSLYSNKDIFLRELVSNAADALDKVRFLALTDAAALGAGPAKDLPLEIKISVDEDRRILSIRDTGVGMTKSDLINNLGTIARSGTAAFLEQMQKGGDLNLIGQFGVGFYSVYLVADYVEVITKHPSSDTQYVWESTASGQFAVSEDVEGSEPLHRGTQINIHLKDEAKEYLQNAKLRELVARYSEFINFPISLLTEKTVEKEVPVVEEDDEYEMDDKEKKGSDKDADDAVEEEEGDEDEKEKEKKPKTKKVTEKLSEWDVLNDAKALWLRPPGNVSDEEYEKFYKVLAKSDHEKPLAHSHFRAEGDVDFKAVLYVPPTAPPDMYDNYYTKKPRVKLYVRRVFISDSFEELLPKWLSFLVGLVDSDSMPLNVSREMLQLAEGMKVIRKKLTRKAIEMIRKLSDAEEKAREGDEEGSGEKKGWFGKKGGSEEEVAKQKEEAITKYTTLWKTFGKAIKMGCIEDTQNRNRLLPLLRFKTSSSDGNFTSLEAYVSRMKENQTGIYYLVGTGGIEELVHSPFVEALTSRGYEVIYFTDPLDEYLMTHVTEYDDKPLINASKDDLKIEEGEDEKAKEKRAQAHFKGLTSWWKAAIGDPSISAVKTSRRLASSPCVVVAGKWGWTATMERIARAQALGDSERATMMRGQRTLEINPRHPLVRELRARWEEDPEDEGLKGNARLLYETCLLESGFLLDDSKAHNERVLKLLGSDLGVSDLTALEEEEYPEIEEKKKGASAKKEGGSGGAGADKDSAFENMGTLSDEEVEAMMKDAKERGMLKDEL